jgi:hydrogenase-1 operon protein HyaE
MNYAEQRAAAFEALLTRLATDSGVLRLAADQIDAEAAQHARLALLYTADPARSPESWDACVVLPELLAGAGFPLRGAILDPVQSDLAAARFGIDKRPALVILREGQYVGVIEGMQDWMPFMTTLRYLCEAPAIAPPVAGAPPVIHSMPRSA